MKYILTGRLSDSPNTLSKVWRGGQKYLGHKMGCEIGWEHAGSGLVLAHPYGITVNGGVKLAKIVPCLNGAQLESSEVGRMREFQF